MKSGGWRRPLVGAIFIFVGGFLGFFASSIQSWEFAAIAAAAEAVGAYLTSGITPNPPTGKVWPNSWTGILCGLSVYAIYQVVLIAIVVLLTLAFRVDEPAIPEERMDDLLLGVLNLTIVACLPFAFFVGRFLMARARSVFRCAAWSYGCFVVVALLMQVAGFMQGQTESYKLLRSEGLLFAFLSFLFLAAVITAAQVVGALTARGLSRAQS
jgi:hypothetical protein